MLPAKVDDDNRRAFAGGDVPKRVEQGGKGSITVFALRPLRFGNLR